MPRSAVGAAGEPSEPDGESIQTTGQGPGRGPISQPSTGDQPEELILDFDDTPEEAAFRAAARARLLAHAPLRTGVEGPTANLVDYDQRMAAAVAWQHTLAAGGWAGLTWPTEFGGRGLGPAMQAIFDEEQAAFDVVHGPLLVGLAMVGPTLIAHGTAHQHERFLPPILRGEEIWCQLFSEPEAGSDLASLRTSARLDGDHFTIEGQKVWTSMAQHAHWGILLARSDPDAPKHRGISYLLIDMRQPGIEVRPLRQMTGAAHFCEVFLTGARVPVEHLVGPLHGGWRVARSTLGSERAAIGGGRAGESWQAIVDLARSSGATTDPTARQRLAAAYQRAQVIRYLGYRAKTALSLGQAPGPEGILMKLLASRQAAAVADLVLELEGPGGTLQDDWATAFLNQWSVRLGGGTDEIQKNILAERILGLPPEPLGSPPPRDGTPKA